VSREEFNTAVNDLRTRLIAITALNGGISYAGSPASTPVNLQTFATAQRIDRLSNITLDGVTGLTDADIPDNITASNYMPLTGWCCNIGEFSAEYQF